MSAKAKYEYLMAIRECYHQVSRKSKTMILDEFCTVCGYYRKYVIRLLNASDLADLVSNLSRSIRKPVYAAPVLVDLLSRKTGWVMTNLPCSR